MSVFRINKTNNYTVMSNYHLKEQKLSLKAKGLLSLMLSLPENWNYSIQGLVSICKENETAIRSCLKELQEFGYIVITKLMPNETKTGRIQYVYNIYEQPQKQEDKKQDVENLYVENPTQLNTNIINTNNFLNNKLFKNNDIKKSGTDLYSFCINCIDDFCSNKTHEKNLRKYLIQYLNFRLEIKDKPLYKNMWKGLLNKLQKCFEESNDNINYVDIVSRSLEKGYLTFYPITDNKYINQYTPDNNIHWDNKYELSEDSYRQCEEKF